MCVRVRVSPSVNKLDVNINSSRTLEQVASLPVPLVPPCGGPFGAACHSTSTKVRDDTLRSAAKVMYTPSRCASATVALRKGAPKEWCYGTLRQMKEERHPIPLRGIGGV